MTVQIQHDREAAATPRLVGGLLVGVLLVALNLRIGITSLGALIDDLRHSIGLSPATASFATSLPVLCFAVVGIAGISLTRRLGAHRGLTVALVLLTLGLAARTLAGSTVLLVGTLVACSGIALANVLLPAVVKERFPTRVGLVTGAYSATLSLGAALGAAATVPSADVAGSWRVGLGVWAGVAALALVWWLPHSRAHEHTPGPTLSLAPMLRSRVAWAVTGLFATQSLVAYVLMSWLPSMYADAGFSHHEAGLLLAFSILVGVPFFFLVPSYAARLRSQGHLVAGLTALNAAGFAGLALAPVGGAWVWAVLLGAGGAVFPVTLTLFSLRTRTSAETAMLSTMAQSIGYLLGAVGPFAVGLLRDSTGSWTLPLLILLALSAAQVAFGYAAGRARVVA